jgi:hypothetical protein
MTLAALGTVAGIRPGMTVFLTPRDIRLRDHSRLHGNQRSDRANPNGCRAPICAKQAIAGALVRVSVRSSERHEEEQRKSKRER